MTTPCEFPEGLPSRFASVRFSADALKKFSQCVHHILPLLSHRGALVLYRAKISARAPERRLALDLLRPHHLAARVVQLILHHQVRASRSPANQRPLRRAPVRVVHLFACQRPHPRRRRRLRREHRNPREQAGVFQRAEVSLLRRRNRLRRLRLALELGNPQALTRLRLSAHRTCGQQRQNSAENPRFRPHRSPSV